MTFFLFFKTLTGFSESSYRLRLPRPAVKHLIKNFVDHLAMFFVSYLKILKCFLTSRKRILVFIIIVSTK